MNDREFDELMRTLDRSLAVFGERPAEPGPDLVLYEELRRIREALIRAQRDLHDPNIFPRSDSRSPLMP